MALLLLLVAVVSFTPFPQALLLGYRHSPLAAAAGLSFFLAIAAILSRALKPSRLLSVLSWLLAVPVLLLMLLATAVAFGPFVLMASNSSPLVIVAGLFFALAVLEILSRASKPSRRLSVLALLLAAPVCFFFSGTAYQLRGLYRLHAVADEACRAARENAQPTSDDAFEHAVRLAKLSPSQSASMVLSCNSQFDRVYITNGFDPVWGISDDGVLH
ncbi:hypothetical protein JYJ95_14720 [Corallococcus exiguus]|uniref:hypothetical protein n=1 Tax=Corallococcus exiguus TaxID=83462 RepID=UPI001A8D5BDD|nr:hypothetical protein [Corallococcus exiguus]MBN8467771.1 hypothetical protein [Corallococcus exiguus]